MAKKRKKPDPAGKIKTCRPKVQGSMALWIMTPFGPLYPSARPAELVEADPARRELQVRARRAEYIDAFRQRYCPELGETEHHRQDYPYKAAVSREDLARAMAAMVLDIDSEVFKPLTEGPLGLSDRGLAADLHHSYTRCWGHQLDDLSDGTSSYDRYYKDRDGEAYAPRFTRAEERELEETGELPW